MTGQYALVSQLRRALSAEMLEAAGLQDRFLTPLFKMVVWPAAHRFGKLSAEFDRRVAHSGLVDGARWILPHFVEGAQAYGAERIPADGPLVIVSNHPGSYDGLVITSNLPRDDLKVVATSRPYFHAMVGTTPYMIFTPRFDAHERMGVIREAIRHLRDGGSLLLFPRGQVEPDPAWLPGAQEALNHWSASLSVLLHRVPEARVLVSIVSGVLAPSCLRNPLTRLRKELHARQLLAEMIQVSQLMLVGRRFGLRPTVRFAEPATVTELGGGRDLQETLAGVTARARGLLAQVPLVPIG